MINGKSLWARLWGGRPSATAVKSGDDVRNLFADLGLNAEQYKEFARSQETEKSGRDDVFIPPGPPRQSRAFMQKTSPVTMPTSNFSAPRENIPREAAPDNLAIQNQPAPQAGTIPQLKSARSNTFALLNAWENKTAINEERNDKIPIVGLASFTGGAGKSTLAAALAVAIARQAGHAIIIGQTAFSPLGYYFASPQRSGTSASSIQQYTYSLPGTSHGVDLIIGDIATEDLVVAARRISGSTAPAILVDLEASPQIDAEIANLDLVLVPLRPDINALVTVERTDLAIARAEIKPRFGVLYILNQFDATRDLHIQVQDLLTRRLGDRLLPFAVPLDNSVQEALASGMPPQIYRESSPFSRAAAELQSQLSRYIEHNVSEIRATI